VPTYEYECDNGHRFEAFQSMKEEPLSRCVECGAKAKRRIGPGAGFLFRGGGFYITDYRSKDYKQKAKAEDSKPSSEAKPDAGGKGKEPKSPGSGKSGSSDAA